MGRNRVEYCQQEDVGTEVPCHVLPRPGPRNEFIEDRGELFGLSLSHVGAWTGSR